MGLFAKLFGTRSERELKKIQPLVDKVLALEEEYKAYEERHEQNMKELEEKKEFALEKEEAVKEPVSAYQAYMKQTLEAQENLSLRQAEVVAIGTENNRVSYVQTRTGARFPVKAVIICSGPYLSGKTTFTVGKIGFIEVKEGE